MANRVHFTVAIIQLINSSYRSGFTENENGTFFRSVHCKFEEKEEDITITHPAALLLQKPCVLTTLQQDALLMTEF